jgi:hypothetical protein
MVQAKGSTLRSTLTFIEQTSGPATLKRVLATLGAGQVRAIEGASPTDEVPLDLALGLWRAADTVLGPEDPQWVERSGAFSIESSGIEMYGGILKKSSPLEFLTQRVSLFRLYYHPGNMEVVEHEPGRAILRLVGFDQADSFFCRRQTGGLQRALELAGGTDPSARHVRCALAGDAFCEWELRWS